MLTTLTVLLAYSATATPCTFEWFKKCFLLIHDRPRSQPDCDAVKEFNTCFDQCTVRSMKIDESIVHDGPTTYLNIHNNDCSNDYVNLNHLEQMVGGWKSKCSPAAHEPEFVL